MPVYRYSGTPVVLELSEESAITYNLVATDIESNWINPVQIIKTTPEHHEVVLRISKGITQEQLDVYGKVSDLINLIISLNDGGLTCDRPMDEAPKFILV